MIKTKLVETVRESIEDVVCDFCKESCRKEALGSLVGFEYAELNASWGYYSDSLDCVNRTLQICQKCWEALLDKYKIPIVEEKDNDESKI